MFRLPLAYLLLTVLGQAGPAASDTNPEILMRKAEQAVLRAELDEIKTLIPIIKKAIDETEDSDLTIRMQKSVWNLEKHEKALSERKIILENTVKNRDTTIPVLGASVERSLLEGKSYFLARRIEIVKLLKASTSAAQVDQMSRFLFEKVLADMDRLVQLDQDPARRAETENLFDYIAGNANPEEPYPSALGKTPLVIKEYQIQQEASRLFGPSSYIRLRRLQVYFSILANEYLRGQIPDVDLEAEMEREFAPYLNSDWAQNLSFKKNYFKLLAWVYLSPKGRSHEKLATLIKDLETINAKYGSPESIYFLETISFRLLMLNQQGRHQECIQEFEKIKMTQLSQVLIQQKINLVDIHQAAAQSYAALGKKDRALLQQELAYFNCQEIPLAKIFLVRFRKSVAKDLRDMYAQNNRWKDARNLEERCQLMGLGFDPLPKLTGE
jgi:hypothetical protein